MTDRLGGVIFDVDGTLLDTMPMWERAATNYLRTLGVAAEEGFDRKLFEMTVPEGVAYTIERYQLDKKPQEVLDGLSAYAYRYYAERSAPKPGMAALVRALHERGIHMAAATSGERAQVEAGLRRNGLLDAMRGLFFCTEVGAGKQSPRVYEAALAAIGNPPREQVWVFEDALFAARTAKAAGFRVCGMYERVNEGEQDELRALCDFYCRDAEDVAQFCKRHVGSGQWIVDNGQ